MMLRRTIFTPLSLLLVTSLSLVLFAAPSLQPQLHQLNMEPAAVTFPYSWETARSEVESEVMSSWRAYRRCAMGRDELSPVSCQGLSWGGKGSGDIGITLIDSLDTLFLMDFTRQFEVGVSYLSSRNHSFDQDVEISVFEATIRVLGGLLSSYQLSSRPVLLEKAKDVADRVFFPVDSPSGLSAAAKRVNLRKGAVGPHQRMGTPSLAEMGSVQLELCTMSSVSKDPKYKLRAKQLLNQLYTSEPADGLWRTFVAKGTATTGGKVDSFLEYVAKMHLLTGDKQHLEVFSRAVKAIEDRLLVKTTVKGEKRWFLAELDSRGSLRRRMEHLSCFLPGLYAMMVLNCDTCRKNLKDSLREQAVQLGKTCYLMYTASGSPLGLAPNAILFSPEGDITPDPKAKYNLLRPEGAEAWFWLWRLTKDPTYREYSYTIFLAFRRHCKVLSTGGYTSISDVTSDTPKPLDRMHSFWLAETLKYLWLTFRSDTDHSVVSGLVGFDWLLNTEAHPLKKIARADFTDGESAESEEKDAG